MDPVGDQSIYSEMPDRYTVGLDIRDNGDCLIVYDTLAQGWNE
jgi:hypothetical protein